MQQVVMCGIPRSGSTLVWQILSEVLPHPILQTHPASWEPDGTSLVVVTIRDPRDVAASLYRVRISRGGLGVGGPEGLENVLQQMNLHFKGAQKILEGPHLLLRYEEFFWSMRVIWDALCRTFGLLIPPPDRERIEKMFSLDANRERASKLKDFNQVGEYHIHGDHVGEAVPGSWVRTLPEWAWPRMKEVCNPLREGWGYADQS